MYKANVRPSFMRPLLVLLVIAVVSLPATDAQVPKVVGPPDRSAVEIVVTPADPAAPLVPDVVYRMPVEVSVTCRPNNVFPDGVLLRHTVVPLYDRLEAKMTPESTTVRFAPEECASEGSTRTVTVHLEARFDTTAYAFQTVLATVIAEAVDLGIEGRKDAILRVGLIGTVAVEPPEGPVEVSSDGCGEIPLRLSTTTNGPVRFEFRADPDDPPRGVLNLVPYRILDAPRDGEEDLELQFCLDDGVSGDMFPLHVAPYADDDRAHRFDEVVVEVTVVDPVRMESPLAGPPTFTLVVALALALLRRR